MIRSLRDLDDYEVAELVRKKTEACVTAIVFGDDEVLQGIAPSVVDADGNRVERLNRASSPRRLFPKSCKRVSKLKKRKSNETLSVSFGWSFVTGGRRKSKNCLNPCKRRPGAKTLDQQAKAGDADPKR